MNVFGYKFTAILQKMNWSIFDYDNSRKPSKYDFINMFFYLILTKACYFILAQHDMPIKYKIRNKHKIICHFFTFKSYIFIYLSFFFFFSACINVELCNNICLMTIHRKKNNIFHYYDNKLYIILFFFSFKQLFLIMLVQKRTKEI